MKLPEINKPDFKIPKLKKPDITIPDFKKPDIKLPKLSFQLTEGKMAKLWAGGSIICIACSGIALIVAIF